MIKDLLALPSPVAQHYIGIFERIEETDIESLLNPMVNIEEMTLPERIHKGLNIK